jgi:Tfp pilus assembly protein PilO
MNSLLAKLLDFIRRWPYSVSCGLLTLLLVGGVVYLHFEIDRLESSLKSKSKEGEEMLDKLVSSSTLRQELTDIRQVTRRIEENLVVETNLAENLWYFYKLEDQTKAQLPELHQVSSPAADKSPHFRRVPYGLRVIGTYEHVAAFLLALETGPRLVKITTFSISRTDPSGASISLDLNVELLGKR